MTAAQFTLGPGATLDGGRYVVDRVLGQGGFGITYRAADTKLDRTVAVKEFFMAGSVRADGAVQPSPTVADQFQDRKERFREEARTLARFRHPGIVQVFEFFDEHNTVYMVMEYLEGRSLRQLLKMAGGRIHHAQAVAYALEIAAALEAVHGEGLLHRDVKPDNALVLDDGHVVLIDFGTARQFAGEATSAMSQTLSPGYAPIEQYSERGRFGPATDVYALGATLYEMVTGEMPAGSIERGVGSELTPPRALVPDLPAHVDAAIRWSMEMDPERRPGSAAEFARALRGEITVPGAAVPPADEDATRLVTGDETRLLPPAPRAPAPPPPPAAPPPSEPQPARRPRTLLWVGVGLAAAGAAAIAAFVIANSGGGTQPTLADPPTTATTLPPGTTAPPPTTATSTTSTPTTTTTSTPITTVPALPADLDTYCRDLPLDPGAPEVRFGQGEVSGAVGGNLGPEGFEQYVLGALAGQTMLLTLDPGAADLPFVVCIEGLADGFLESGLNGLVSSPLPLEQNYQLTVAALGAGGPYGLEIVIPPPVPPQGLEAGLFCRDISDRSFNFSAALSYWVREGRPARMDADGDGIPCETVYAIEEIEAQFFVATIEPPGLFCRDLAQRGWDFVNALAYWVAFAGPTQMDADGNGIPCETVYTAAEIDAVLLFDR